jgi:phage terminase large subunit GpA-like protein
MRRATSAGTSCRVLIVASIRRWSSQTWRWPEGTPREAEYACCHCGALIGERHKTWMLEHGEWRPTAEGDGRTAGFHLSSLYSPVGWFNWADAAEMYEQARLPPSGW